MTLPEVVTGELAGKFGEISLFDQHADFELGSASNSNLTSPWATVCEPATQPRMWIPHPASASRVAPATSAGPAQRLPLHTGPTRSPYPSTTRTPTPPRPRLGLHPPLRLLLGLRVRVGLRVGPRGSRVQGQLYRTTLIRTDFWAGYNVHTRREIRLLTRPQARRPDRWELTLRRLPRLASLPGGNTTRPS
jgi:hypothetical protein